MHLTMAAALTPLARLRPQSRRVALAAELARMNKEHEELQKELNGKRCVRSTDGPDGANCKAVRPGFVAAPSRVVPPAAGSASSVTWTADATTCCKELCCKA